MPSDPLRVALAQASSVPADVDANVRRAVSTLEEASRRGAHLVAFPELFLTGYELARIVETPRAWLEERDDRLDPIRRACAESGITAILGAPMKSRDGARVIAAPVIGPRGDVGISMKQYVHGSEASLFASGAPLPPFQVRGWHVAIAVCFDTAHPRHAENAARSGADLYVSTSLYTDDEARRCDLHLGARAMDHRMFAALANYAGTTTLGRSCGLTGVWGPRGDVVARAPGAGEALVVVDLDPDELRPFRIDA